MKKGQLQIYETVMVVLIVVVIILAGMIFFYRYNMAGIENDYKENEDTRFRVMIATFPESAEIKCSINGYAEGCVDGYRVVVFSRLVELNKQYYVSRYGFKNISMRMVYPQNSSKLCELNSLDDCGVWDIYSHVPEKYETKRVIHSVAAIYNPVKQSYSLGVITIEEYRRETG